MKITPEEALKLEIWERICKILGYNVYILNEGLIQKDTILDINIE